MMDSAPYLFTHLTRLQIAALALLLCAVSGPRCDAAFGISSVSGAEFSAVKPASVVAGETEDGSVPIEPIVFVEAIDQILDSALSVDHVNTGSSVLAQPILRGNNINTALTPGSVDRGLAVNSYFFHFDPASDPFEAVTYNVALEFDSPVLGVQLFSEEFDLAYDGSPYTGTLEEGDAVFGAGVDYPAPPDSVERGVEEDAFMLVIDGNEVLLSGSVFGASIDQVRIITLGSIDPDMVVPEMTSAATWGLLVGAVGLLKSRSSRRRNRS